MAVYNTGSDSANTAVRALLTKIGEYYWGQPFNTGSGSGKKVWLEIKTEIFNLKCAYCGVSSSNLQIEHLIMFNRTEYGLHHPGNVVPCCKACNTRTKNAEGTYVKWEEHLSYICRDQNSYGKFEERRDRILNHIKSSKFAYPQLSVNEKHAIRVIANSLYNGVKSELDKSLQLYKNLDEAFELNSRSITN